MSLKIPYKLIHRLLFAFLILAPGMVMAEEQTAVDESAQQEYLTPDKMTPEDREMLTEYSNNYNNCLTETSIQQMQHQADPRHVVDFAMKHCAVELETLNTKMIARNFDPAFRQGYLRRVSMQGANQTLKVVMIGMANQQSSSEAEQPAQQ